MDNETYTTLKKEVQKLKKLPGQQRGEHIKYMVDYVRKEKGEEGLNRLLETLKKLDFDIGDVKELGHTEWIPESIPHVFLVAAARVFGWDKKEIFKMGRSVIPYSTTIKVYIKYFSSIKKTLKRAIDKWNKDFSRGKLELKEFDKKNGKAVLTLSDFDTHPLVCDFLRGDFTGIITLITGSKNARVKETKCMSRGYNHHEFVLEW